MLRNIVLNSIDRSIMIVARLLSVILIARFLGPEGYGVFQFALTTSIIAATLADFGFGIANNYLASRYPRARPKLLGNTLIFVGGVGTTIALLSGIMITAFRNYAFPELPKTYLWLIPLSVPIQAIQISLIGLVYGANRFKEKVSGTSLHYVLFLFSITLFAFFGLLTTNNLMLFWIIGLSISSLYWIKVLLKDGLGKPQWDRANLKKQFSYGCNAYIYNVSHILNFRLDMILVAYFLKAEHVGWYALATSVTETLLYLPKALSNVVLTETATEVKNGTKPNHYLVYKGTILIIGVAILGTAILAPFLLPLVFSSSFIPAITPLLLLLPGTLAMALGIIAAYHLFGLGKASQPSLAALAATIVTIALDLVLIPFLGIQGAALASTIAYIVFCFMCLHFVLSETKVSMILLLIPKKHDIEILLRLSRNTLSSIWSLIKRRWL